MTFVHTPVLFVPLMLILGRRRRAIPGFTYVRPTGRPHVRAKMSNDLKHLARNAHI